MAKVSLVGYDVVIAAVAAAPAPSAAIATAALDWFGNGRWFIYRSYQRRIDGSRIGLELNLQLGR
ncbi:hypothetical protein [Paraburkholderia elongata]|uniref:hypothetical protein n=1 Tax=Paraburkholderia elongata TaxID=2675747 RepID=UPI001556CD2B|nr:hypothetical protein [Paraburkholderia elongata]